MNDFSGIWVDEGGIEISINQSISILNEVDMGSKRGVFKGFVVNLGTPAIVVEFTDGQPPNAGLQVGVLNHTKTAIHWGNSTTWNKVNSFK